MHRDKVKQHPQPIRKLRLFDQVCENLREFLPSLGPNAELNEVELCRSMGLSRTPIREALIHLAGEGLVEFQTNGRRQVVGLNRRDAAELFDIRIVLEGLAAYILAPKITKDQIERLRELAECVDDAWRNKAQQRRQNMTHINKCEIQFHGNVTSMAGNAHLAEALERQNVLMRCLTSPCEFQNFKVEPVPAHVELVDALASGDPDRAEASFRSHVIHGKEILLQVLDSISEERMGEKLES